MAREAKVISLYDYDLSELHNFANYVERETKIKIMRSIENKIIDHVLENSCWQGDEYTKPLQEIVNMIAEQIEITAK